MASVWAYDVPPIGPDRVMATDDRFAKPEPLTVIVSPALHTVHETVSFAVGVDDPLAARSARVGVKSRVRMRISCFMNPM